MFTAWVQKLVAAMRATAANSIGSQLALMEATGWIGTARKQILELRYQAAQYRQMLDDAADSSPLAGLGSPDTRPHPPAGWYEDLSQQAREIMTYMEVRVFHSA